MDDITPAQWVEYEDQGFLRLGSLDHETLSRLRNRIDDIMMGKADVDYDRMLMQLNSEDGTYGKIGQQSKGHKGATLAYRKIQDLEWDPVFLEYIQRPLWRDICDRVYGSGTRIACNRAMFMNKPANFGTFLRWHQDRWPILDQDPKLTIYTALDTANAENGCMRIVPGFHRTILNPEAKAGTLSDEMVSALPEDGVMNLELDAGEVVMLHNWLPHSSGANRSENARRAFSVCYQDATTVDDSGETYQVVFGDGALTREVIGSGRQNP